jgi:hypothetical protein
MKMRKKATVIVILILTASWLLPTLCSAAVTMTGITKTFNPQSGRLVLTTQSRTETTLYIPKTVKVYIKTKDGDIAITEADTWKFLADNLFKGTKLTLEKIESTVTTIWVLEVPS